MRCLIYECIKESDLKLGLGLQNMAEFVDN